MKISYSFEQIQIQESTAPSLKWFFSKKFCGKEKNTRKIMMLYVQHHHRLWFDGTFIGSLPLMVCVKETATAANDTLDITCPRAWQNAAGARSAKSSLSIGRMKSNLVNWTVFFFFFDFLKKNYCNMWDKMMIEKCVRVKHRNFFFFFFYNFQSNNWLLRKWIIKKRK